MPETITALPGRLRIAFTNTNWIQVTVPEGVQQLDLAFEDTNGTAVLGYAAVGYLLNESTAPAATDPKVAAYSIAVPATRRAPRQLSVALANNHFCSIIVV